MTSEREPYTMGYGDAATYIMSLRTAEKHAAFFIPHLRPGMKVLDSGCGPGTITLGFAKIVDPGEVIGTEIEPSQVEIASKNAQRFKVDNVRFETADLYQLPFEDNSFDAVFISAVLANLREPSRGVGEAYRVLKPGGVIGVKDFDHGGDLTYPHDGLIERYSELYIRLRKEYGHEPNSGRRLGDLLFRAGFESIKFSAVYESFTFPTLMTFAEMSSDLIKETWGEEFEKRGWATPEELKLMIEAWPRFAQLPGAIFAAAWCEAIGFKAPDRSNYPR